GAAPRAGLRGRGGRGPGRGGPVPAPKTPQNLSPPPLSAANGRTIPGATRHGKFLDIELDGGELHLVTHLARAGWLHYRDALAPAPLKPGKGPIALRVRLDDGSGFDLTEAGTQKKLAVYLVTDPVAVPGIARLGPDALA